MWQFAQNQELATEQWVVVLAFAIVGASIDLSCRRLPNWLTAPFFVSGLAWAATTGGLSGLGTHFLAALVLMVPFVVLFAVAGGGAGDAKMMAGVGAWLGFHVGVVALVAVVLSGIVLGLLWSLGQGKLKAVCSNVAAMVTVWIGGALARQGLISSARVAAPRQATVAMPYGLAILAGVAITVGMVAL